MAEPRVDERRRSDYDTAVRTWCQRRVVLVVYVNPCFNAPDIIPFVLVVTEKWNGTSTIMVIIIYEE
jgi:hypothetical protein